MPKRIQTDDERDERKVAAALRLCNGSIAVRRGGREAAAVERLAAKGKVKLGDDADAGWRRATLNGRGA